MEEEKEEKLKTCNDAECMWLQSKLQVSMDSLGRKCRSKESTGQKPELLQHCLLQGGLVKDYLQL